MSTDWQPSLWKDSFEETYDEELGYGDRWSFNFNYSQTDEITMMERKRGWKVYNHCAYGKFSCSTCSKIWSSARVVVLFRYRLLSEMGRGTVTMRPFGQACRRCREDKFDLPGFSQEEVDNALLKLFKKIRKNCYGEEESNRDDSDGSAGSYEVRTRPHEKALCEACKLDICNQDDLRETE